MNPTPSQPLAHSKCDTQNHSHTSATSHNQHGDESIQATLLYHDTRSIYVYISFVFSTWKPCSMELRSGVEVSAGLKANKWVGDWFCFGLLSTHAVKCSFVTFSCLWDVWNVCDVCFFSLLLSQFQNAPELNTIVSCIHTGELRSNKRSTGWSLSYSIKTLSVLHWGESHGKGYYYTNDQYWMAIMKTEWECSSTTTRVFLVQ